MGFTSICTAIWDFQALSDSELEVKEGDILYILEKSTEGWWKAKKKAAGEDEDEPEGLIPSTYVEDAKPIHTAKALYDYTRQTEGEVSFTKDASIHVYDVSDPDWSLVAVDGDYGFAPANYIEITGVGNRSSKSDGKPRPKPDQSKVRTWTDHSGSFKVDAQFLGVADGKIHLHKVNGVKIAVPMTKMSQADLDYVEKAKNGVMTRIKQALKEVPVRQEVPPASGEREYDVGWICAVRTEYVVACELLDEDYPTPRSLHDNNAYTCGRMGNHNVAVACLPIGTYGLTAAAVAAKDMLRSFPSIRFVLMVGIGGGAPSQKHDIRLGDVVVSTPVGRTGGVIHYEFGKTIQNQKFERTGTLNAPPPILRTMVQKLSALHERRGHQIRETVTQMITRNARLKVKYRQPDPQSDILYKSSFTHTDPKRPCMGLCRPHAEQIVERAVRDGNQDDPMIHYGLIASADRLMKDAQVRDCLAETEGVLCFEMEAAGLTDNFPCLVIRGICDYSDTHKNDVWQGYAAAAAAAYAKELLSVIPSEVVNTLQPTLSYV